MTVRRFLLESSGEVVAEGAVLPSGRVVLEYITQVSVHTYNSMDVLKKIVGDRITWIDQLPEPNPPVEVAILHKRNGHRRTKERRYPKRGVNVRVHDKDNYVPKRVRRGQHENRNGKSEA